MKTIRILTALFAMIVMTASAQPAPDNEEQAKLPRMSVKGRIAKIEGQRAVLITPRGRNVTVNLGPENFWRDRGYRLDEGTDVTVDGWGEYDDEDGGYIFAGGIRGDNFSFDICDSRGFPYWADRDDYEDGWYPQRDRFEVYFFGSPWVWGPPPRWWDGPRWRWHRYWYRHHAAPPPPPWWGRGHHDRNDHRGPDWNDRPRNERDRDHRDRRDNPPPPPPERRDGRRGH
jgi:hypothetical protein